MKFFVEEFQYSSEVTVQENHSTPPYLQFDIEAVDKIGISTPRTSRKTSIGLRNTLMDFLLYVYDANKQSFIL